MYAIIPALNPDPLDLACVVRACRIAELTPFVAWQGSQPDDALRGLGVGYLWSSTPLGKGGAIKASLSDIGGLKAQPFVVVDADLYALDPAVLDRARQSAENVPLALVRGRFDSVGRVGRIVEAIASTGLYDATLRGLSEFDGSTLLSGVQAYGAEVWDRCRISDAPEGYGWDVWMALHGLDNGMTPVPISAGPRIHRSGSTEHVATMLDQVLAAMFRGDVAWSA